ncbi:class I SAM-dependent methyltransferase [Alkalibacillus aidingensis]|uniref:class I SAM-dependent methyltransferase n=1 Tax=Alkalibacillus aidingensis TaxID=2747607 RepID=UPI0016605610|nr:class I SAM-dependent methyltransferase [Alkalibacillus aidingensis]
MDHNESKALHEYWKKPGDNNRPERYLRKLTRSEFLYNYIQKYVDQNARLLEPGCNIGRNLNFLFERGYQKVAGIEINEEAVQLLNKHFPDLGREADIYEGTIEEVITNFKDDHFDLTFSMAVLEHIHPDSDWVFKEISRVTHSYLIIIEDETWDSSRHFPRNYQEIFEKHGFNQIEENTKCKGFGKGYVCRVFKKER